MRTGSLQIAHQFREGEDAGGELSECQLQALAGRSEDVILVQEASCLAVSRLPDLDAVVGRVAGYQCALRVHQLVLGAPPILWPAPVVLTNDDMTTHNLLSPDTDFSVALHLPCLHQ